MIFCTIGLCKYKNNEEMHQEMVPHVTMTRKRKNTDDGNPYRESLLSMFSHETSSLCKFTDKQWEALTSPEVVLFTLLQQLLLFSDGSEFNNNRPMKMKYETFTDSHSRPDLQSQFHHVNHALDYLSKTRFHFTKKFGCLRRCWLVGWCESYVEERGTCVVNNCEQL